MSTAVAVNPYRDAIALLLADLDGDGPERGAVILELYAGDWQTTGQLLRALQNTVLYFGTRFADKTKQELRDELQILAEGLMLA